MKPDRVAVVSAALAREAKEAARGRRDARRDIAAAQREKAKQPLTPAHLANLFPGLVRRPRFERRVEVPGVSLQAGDRVTVATADGTQLEMVADERGTLTPVIKP